MHPQPPPLRQSVAAGSAEVNTQTPVRRPVGRWAGPRWSLPPRTLWVAFGAVHAWLVLVGVVLLPRKAFYDLVLYRNWVGLGLHGGPWPVLDVPSVYPVGALVPMLIPAAISTTSTAAYALGWSALVTALDAVAVRALVRRGGTRGAGWWLVFLVLLGPVAMGRIDAIVAPIVIVALLASTRRPAVAAGLITVAAWIKVAPGVLLLPLLTIARRRLRDVVAPAALVTGGIVAAVALGGGLRYVASFLSAQDARGLQVEAVSASPWVLAALARDDVRVLLNVRLATWEIVGPGTAGVARALDLVLPLAVVGLAALIWRARARPLDVLAWAPLALVTLLIVANKVGSPQYIGWLAPPIAVAVASRTPGLGPPTPDSGFRTRIAGLALLIAVLTQVVFPLSYRSLLTGNALIAVILVVRNVALVALLGAVTARLAHGPPGATAPGPAPLSSSTVGPAEPEAVLPAIGVSVAGHRPT